MRPQKTSMWAMMASSSVMGTPWPPPSARFVGEVIPRDVLLAPVVLRPLVRTGFQVRFELSSTPQCESVKK